MPRFAKKHIDLPEEKQLPQNSLFVYAKHQGNFLSRIFSPRAINRFFILLFLLIFPVYFSLSFERNVFSPRLEINSPANMFATSDAKVTVSGSTDPETEIFINGGKIVPEEHGRFQEVVPLTIGVNTITLKARRGSGETELQRIVVRN